MALKPKTRAMLDILAGDSKKSATQAYIETHEVTNRLNARVNASQILKKPEAQVYLDKHVNKARNKIVELVDSNKEDIALKASESILDRNLGKPLTRTNNTNISLSLEELMSQLS